MGWSGVCITGEGGKTNDAGSFGASGALTGVADDIFEYAGTLVGILVGIRPRASSSDFSHDIASKSKTKIAHRYA